MKSSFSPWVDHDNVGVGPPVDQLDHKPLTKGYNQKGVRGEVGEVGVALDKTPWQCSASLQMARYTA